MSKLNWVFEVEFFKENLSQNIVQIELTKLMVKAVLQIKEVLDFTKEPSEGVKSRL